MASYSTSDFRPGLKILLDGEPCSILETEFVKPGKGQGFNRTKIRYLQSGRVVEKTFKSGENVEAADVLEKDMRFLYSDGSFWYFMNEESFEQVAAEERVVGHAKQWLKEQDLCTIVTWGEQVIQVIPPSFATLQVSETEPGVRGDTSSGGSKAATLETGAEIRVPLFIEQGEYVKVDTRTSQYVSRVKG